MKTRSWTPIVILLLLASTLVQYGCGGGGSDSGPTSSGSSISGGVTAPGGVIAFNRPHSLWRMFARLFVGEAVADLPGVASVGAGVTVSLIQIDNSGNQVGAALGTTTTDGSGNYTLTLPAGITLGPNYVIQAGSSGTHIQSFITGTTVNVDPYTHATVTLITGAVGAAQGSITGVSTADIAAVQQTVLQTSGDVSTTGTTASLLVTALQTSIANNVESNHIVTSITAPGAITGTVTDSGGAAVAGVQIMVRTFGDQTTMAITRTDASGNYTVHVPAGDYIVGALNDTATSTAASQWWTASGGTISTFLAEKVTVATTAVTKNFSLAAGGRISGTVTAGTSSTTLPGIQVTLCSFASGQTLMWVRTQPDGTYNFNVAPGDYYLTFRNSTLASYGTGIYNSAITGGGTNKTQGEKITVTAGASLTANIGLVAGGLISGTVTDGTTNTAGIAVRFQDSTGAYAESTRTGLDGTYRIWVQPGQYNVLCRGQQYSSTSTATTLGTALTVTAGATVPASFTTALGTITTTVTDASGNPVGGANAYVYDTTGSYNMLGYEITGGDGRVMLYGPTGTNLRVAFVVFDGRMIGSQVYSGQLNYPTAGNNVNIPASPGTISLGTINLPAGGVLKGTVTKSGSAIGNSLVQVRLGGKSGAYRIQTTRTMSDGSYMISLPAVPINRLCAADNSTNLPTGATPPPAGSYAYSDTVSITAGSTTTASTLAY